MGTKLTPSPDTFLQSQTSSIYSLLPPLDSVQGTELKFEAQAVNINTTDDITPGQVKALRAVLEKYPKL